MEMDVKQNAHALKGMVHFFRKLVDLEAVYMDADKIADQVQNWKHQITDLHAEYKQVDAAMKDKKAKSEAFVKQCDVRCADAKRFAEDVETHCRGRIQQADHDAFHAEDIAKGKMDAATDKAQGTLHDLEVKIKTAEYKLAEARKDYAAFVGGLSKPIGAK